MYTKYFGFDEKPFTLTPNPRFIFLSKNHKEAFAHLLYGINNHYGFIELIGEVGTGKTTVLRTLLNQLQEENYRTALIVNPCLTGVELLRSICHEFGLESKSEYANELLIEINKFLLQETAAGRTVVLVIDESQNLQPAVLEQIRLISNLETDNDKLIQIILAGQPELAELLERPELRQLNQRIAVRYRLKSMSMFETRAYIRHRMIVAGETGGVSFSLFATRWIYLYTRGVPRMINILCDRALLIGYGDERRRITAGIITRAIRELLNVPQNRRLSLVFCGLLCVVIICFAVIMNFFGWKPFKGATTEVVANTTLTATAKTLKPEKATSLVKQEDQHFQRLQQEVLSYDQNDMHLLAFNGIAIKTGVSPIKILKGDLTVPDAYSRLAAKRNLSVTEFKGSLDDVIRFDLPFIVKTRIQGTIDSYCVAVTGASNDLLSISPALFGVSTISRNDLNSITSGIFYLVWQNTGQIPYKLRQGERRFEIRTLQQLLKKAGKYNGTIDGDYSDETVKAVSDFQNSAGIKQNETVGELTIAALAKYNTSRKALSSSLTGN